MNRIKRTVSLLLVLTILLACIPQIPLTAKAVELYYYSYSVLNGAATITEGKDTLSGDITLPTSLDGYPVTCVSSSAFAANSKITGIKIPNGITTIGREAFYGCTALTSVEIGDTVTSIGENAFWLCSALETVHLGNSVTSIPRGMFMQCSSLKYVNIPNSVTSIGEFAFMRCVSLTSLDIPGSVISIDEKAVDGCYNLTQINVASNNTVYCSDDGDLLDKQKTTLLYVPGGKTGSYRIPESVTVIGSNALSDCSDLTSVYIPASVDTIRSYPYTGYNDAVTLYFKGSAPATIEPASENLTAVAYYYPDETWTKDVRDSFGGNIRWKAQGECKHNYVGVVVAPVLGEKGYTMYTCNICDDSYVDDFTEIIASGNCGINGDNLKWELDISGNLTISGTGAMAKYTSTANVPWNGYRDSILSVSIESGVTTIGDYAFSNCQKITELPIPDTVTAVGSYAFNRCVKLTDMQFPDSVTTIGQYAFQVCDGLNTVSIPASVTSIGYGIFFGCGNLTAIEVDADNQNYCDENGVLFTKDGANLICCPGGKSGTYIVPDSVTTINARAFYFCKKLTSVVITGNVTAIKGYAFSQSGLKEIRFRGSAPSIKETAFETLTATAYYYPDESWTADVLQNYGGTITWKALGNCDHDYTGVVTAPVLGNEGYTTYTCSKCGDSYVGDYNDIFASGTCGESVTWKLNVYGTLTISGTGETNDYSYGAEPSWSDYRGSIKKLVIESGVTGIGYGIFDECTGLTSVTISNTVTSIEASAFLDCTGLTSVEIPASVAVIDTGAFLYCRNLSAIHVDANNQTYSDDDGVVFNKEKTVLLICPEGRKGDYGVPDSVVDIEASAFWCCSGLTSIFIPDTVTSIGAGAFFNCSSITSINIPDAVTGIGALTFSNCSGLTKVDIPAAVTSVGNSAFYNCTALKEIHFEGSAPTIGKEAFHKVTATAYYYPDETWTNAVMLNYDGTITWVALEKCAHNYVGVVTAPVMGTPGYTTYTCSKCGESYVGDNNDIFASGTCGENVTWKLDVYGTLAISGTGTMTNYASVSEVPWNNYKGSVGKVVIENGVTSIGNESFSNCENLTNVSIPETVTSIGDSAFSTCPGLTSVEIPNDVTAIGNGAFANCVGLTDVEIPASVTTVGMMAFAYSYNLKEILFKGSAPTIRPRAFTDMVATIHYYPDETWTEDVMQNYGGTITWVALNKCEHEFTDWMDIALDGVTYKIRACKKCGYVETDLPEDLVHLHDWQIESYKSPTCTEPGYKDYVWCSNCDLVAKKESVDPLGHDHSNPWQKDADGHWKLCAREGCGQKIDEADHKYGDWITDTEPGCETEGAKHRVCSECKYEEDGDIPAKDHDHSGKLQYDDETGHYRYCGNGCGKKLDEAAHDPKAGQVVAPTCTEDGYTVYSCACGYSEDRDPVPADHDHSGAWKYDGTDHWKLCARKGCGQEIDKEAHDCKKGAVTEPTCTEDGYTTYNCECGYSEKRDLVTKLGHDHSGEWQYDETNHWKDCGNGCGQKLDGAAHDLKAGKVVVPTCTEDGYTTYTCECGYSEKRDAATKLGHDHSGKLQYDDETGHYRLCGNGCGQKLDRAAHDLKAGQVVAPTCTEDGYTVYTCECGYSEDRDPVSADHDHSNPWQYDGSGHWKLCAREGCGQKIDEASHSHSWKTVKEETCTIDGEKLGTCECGHTKTEAIPAAHQPGSVWVFDEREHWHVCGRCSAHLGIAAHELKSETKTEPCTVDGVDTTKTIVTVSCSLCDYSHSTETVHTHVLEYHGAIPATCTEPGKTEGLYCTTCQTWVQEQTEIKALGHDESGPWHKNAEKHWKICGRCEDTICENAHSYAGWVTEIPADCEMEGVERGTCQCGRTETRATEALEHDHTGVWQYNGMEHWKSCARPNCGKELDKGAHDHSGAWQKDGNTHWKVCGCGMKLDEAIHDLKAGKPVEPTCTEDGYTVYTCECGYSEQRDTVTKLGHDHSGIWQKDASGHWKNCGNNCGQRLDAAGHDYGDWITDTEPGCETKGAKHRVCTECRYEDKADIPALGHDESGAWQYSEEKHWKVCGTCQENILEGSHSYGDWITDTPAGCETTGSKHRSCKCGHGETDTIPVLGHIHNGPWQHDDAAHWRVCTRPGCNEPLDVNGHTFGEYHVSTEKTTRDGQTVFAHYLWAVCEDCDYEWKSDVKHIHAHEKVTVVPSALPTCTAAGATTGLICAECSEVLIAQTEIPALGHNYVDGVCSRCGEKAMIGDFNGDGVVSDEDVIWLLWYTVFPEDYQLNGPADFTGDGVVTDEDVIHLLWHTVFPEDYPLE